MMGPGGGQPSYVATRPIDFRKGHDGLSAIVQEMFGLDPFLCVGRDYVAEGRWCMNRRLALFLP